MLSTKLFRKFSEGVLVLTSNHNYVCKAVINRPKTLNALTIPIIDYLQVCLKEWNEDKNIRVVLFSSEGGKAFCAGGNVRSLYLAREEGKLNILYDFFFKEYCLDYALSRMRPMQISIYDGIVMGGGAGISMHSLIKIATDNSIFAMPECSLGLYPDVSGGYFLPRLPGSVGLYLALTGARLTDQELVQAGVATHYVPKDKIDELKEALIKNVKPDLSIQEIESIVYPFTQEVVGPLPYAREIDKYFGGAKNVEEIYERLNDGNSWSADVLKRTEKHCPLSLKVSFEQYKRGKFMSLPEVFKMEYNLSLNFMLGTEFFEGFRALLLVRDRNPQWKYKTLAEVSDDLVKSYFELPKGNFVDLDVEYEMLKANR
ncbi:hypothetical protein SteCoe_5959 [Stentor coeruleus]|uniref:3-hydroxyisobutyryl-CoA hydrolase n=1 Tax=Stentor coeruleus TaxID=5963 RepID=A0A1R2CR62_9CILI|nr:hypothetical protein SteCoe_5959 [Stentor coeruleus]